MIHDNEFIIRGTLRKVVQVPGAKKAKSQAMKDIRKEFQLEQSLQDLSIKPYRSTTTDWIKEERQKLIDGGEDVNPLP